MAEPEVVIVDANGTEHVFPAGFDPKKAAAIVSGQQRPQTTAPPAAPASGLGTMANAFQTAKSVAGTAVNAAGALAPTVGGIIGGMTGGASGAAVGGAAGQGYKELIEHAREIPGAMVDVARNLVQQPSATVKGFAQGATEGAKQAGMEGGAQAVGQLAGEKAVQGVGVLSKWLMNRATTRVTAQLAREFPNLSDTLIDNALTVSEGGYGKAKALLMAAKAKATQTLAAADAAGQRLTVDLTPDLGESLKTALLEKAVKAGQLQAPAAGQPVTSATQRLPGPMRTLFQQIDHAIENQLPLALKPSEADLFKTQLQKESRALYLNRFAPNGAKAMTADSTVVADYAAQLNTAIDGLASGYKAANAEAQPLVGAVRGLKQAIRPSGNLVQAMVRPAVGAALGGITGESKYGHVGGAVGAVAGAAMTSPAMMSREAIALAHPAVQAVLRQLPKPLAQVVIDALSGSGATTPQQSPSGEVR